MGYKIVYGPELIEPRRSLQIGRIKLFTSVFLLVFALTARHTWPEGTEKLREFLIPGEPTVTEAVFSRMIDDLRQGEPVGDALTAFCAELIEEGRCNESSH